MTPEQEKLWQEWLELSRYDLWNWRLKEQARLDAELILTIDCEWEPKDRADRYEQALREILQDLDPGCDGLARLVHIRDIASRALEEK